jgi:peptidoglycan hydrolase CwlO-like protein
MAKIDTKIDTRNDTRIDLDSMSIEDLAALRDNANAKLLEKIAARQVELEAEMDRLAQYGKPAKKAAVAAPAAPKAKKSEKKSEEQDASVAEAA